MPAVLPTTERSARRGTRQAAPPLSARRRLASPLLRTYRTTDPAAALAVLITGWLTGHAPRPATLTEVLALPVSVADVLLLLGFLWVWPLVCEAAGLYHPELIPGSARELRRVLRAATLGSLLPLGAAFLTLGDSLHLADLAIFWPASAGAMLAVRAAVRLADRGRRRHPRKVVLAGSGPRALDLWSEITSRPELGMEIVGFLDEEGDDFARRTGLRWLGEVGDCERALLLREVDEVLITLPVRSHYAAVQSLITHCEHIGIDARYFADLFQCATRPPRMDRSGAVRLRIFPTDSRRLAKRALDVVLSAAALLLAAPLMALIALAVRLDSPGPVLYAQERYGLHRHRFRVWKFRTMTDGADRLQAALEARNEAEGPLFKIREDPRVTRVGRLLRRSSLDELPQLFNVLRGEMSLVGPRPLPVRDVERFPDPWLMRRFGAPPGLTGLWQVHGRSDLGYDDLATMDLQYIDQWSLGLDLRILFATVPAVLRGHGAM